MYYEDSRLYKRNKQHLQNDIKINFENLKTKHYRMGAIEKCHLFGVDWQKTCNRQKTCVQISKIGWQKRQCWLSNFFSQIYGIIACHRLKTMTF